MNLSDFNNFLEEEKKRQKMLQKIQKDFYIKMSNMLKIYKIQIDTYKTDSKEYIEALNLFNKLKDDLNKLMNIRIRKIIDIALLEINNNLTILSDDYLSDEENALYNIIKKTLKSYKENVINKLINGEDIDKYKYYVDIKQ
jgi:DNA replication initiation complex subunit (GINS family)